MMDNALRGWGGVSQRILNRFRQPPGVDIMSEPPWKSTDTDSTRRASPPALGRRLRGFTSSRVCTCIIYIYIGNCVWRRHVYYFIIMGVGARDPISRSIHVLCTSYRKFCTITVDDFWSRNIFQKMHSVQFDDIGNVNHTTLMHVFELWAKRRN